MEREREREKRTEWLWEKIAPLSLRFFNFFSFWQNKQEMVYKKLSKENRNDSNFYISGNHSFLTNSQSLLYFVFSIQFTVNKICWWLDSNCWSLGTQATALPTAPQPLYQLRHNHCPLIFMFDIGRKASNKDHTLGTICRMHND